MSIRFGRFTLDLTTRLLTEAGRERHLSPKAFELLAALVAVRPAVLSKAALQEQLWPSTFVTEASLSNLIAEIRRALGDRGRNSQWIRTAHGFGYAFSGDPVAHPDGRDAGAGSTRCWLEWGRHRFPLSIGEHTIGRDPDVEIRLDAPSISRRHATIRVTPAGVWLEDAGSKNGTRLADARLAAPVQLADGDTIHVGALRLTIHVPSAMASTETLAHVIP